MAQDSQEAFKSRRNIFHMAREPEQPKPSVTVIEGLKAKIRTVPDFPKKGILFYDITTLLQDPKAFKSAIRLMAGHYKGRHVDVIASAEARGFIFGAALAYDMGLPFVPIRKPGKLPFRTERAEYDKEYGKDCLEMHVDGVGKGHKVLLVDDLLATGGTIKAAADLVGKLGGELAGFCFLIELASLNGRDKLAGYGKEVYSLIKYD